MTAQLLLAHYINAAHAANQQRRYEEAKRLADLATTIAPAMTEAWFNLGVAEAGLERRDAAVKALIKAKGLAAGSSQALDSIGFQLMHQSALEEAETCFQEAMRLTPEAIGPVCNLAVLRRRQDRLEEELALLQKAVAMQPKLAPLHLNLGLGLFLRRKHADAEASLRNALALDPKLKLAWGELGVILAEKGNSSEAIKCFETCLALDPDFIEGVHGEGLLGPLLRAKMSICEWSGLKELVDQLHRHIKLERVASNPHQSLSVLDDPKVQRQSISTFTGKIYPEPKDATKTFKTQTKGRVRIAYFSADFRYHPVGKLIAELLELHDRERFEVFCFSLARVDNDPIQHRIRNGVDQFFDVQDLELRELHDLAISLRLDVAIDLNGHTAGSRIDIFARRVAPAQVSYLGFAGTMGAAFYDYLITDKTVCPPDSAPCYTEKLAYLPGGFMPHDSRQPISDKPMRRADFGLPERSCVFSCFNNYYKFTPEVFDTWMNILRKCEGSVLWLSNGPAEAQDNLRAEARGRGINPARIVFASRVDDDAEYLARMRLADLFLDTAPYNAHATAVDALWAGLPLLTCPGRTFASRVAASLLEHMDLPELITASPLEYEALAIELATNPERLGAIRDKLHRNRLTTPLFNTEQRTRALEQLYLEMHRRNLLGLAPEMIDAAPTSPAQDL